MPPRPSGSRLVSLIDLDQELGRWLKGERLVHARRQLVGRVLTLPKGQWDVAPVQPAGPSPPGGLIVDGFVARELVMGSKVSVELFGPGDLVRPWDEDGSLLPIVVRWNVLSPVRMIVIGATLTARLSAFPEVGAELFARMHKRAQRLAETQAISHANKIEVRLLAMLWHLADRWGRVTVDGTVVPLALSHRMMAELVGARRPTVSNGFAELERQGAVVRRSDGSWLLIGSPPTARESGPRRLIPPRRRLVQPEPHASLAAARSRRVV